MIQMIPDSSAGAYTAATPLARPHRSHDAHEAPSATASVVAASTTRDVDASLSITTKEGDTFTITANFDSTATYAGIRGRGEHGASAWNVSSSSQVSVQVQGDLSAQEMKDISRIVKTFLHDLRGMMKGGDVSVANVAGGDPQTLQSVSATAQVNTTVTAIAASITGGRLPRPQAGGDSDLRPDHDVDGGPKRAAVPLPGPAADPQVLTPEVAAAIA